MLPNRDRGLPRAIRAAIGNIPVARPRLPPASAILPYLRRIDRAAWYSNHGPLAQELQQRLAEHWGLERGEVVLLSNATNALTLALMASGAAPGARCLMPSWTFAASAGAVLQAGLTPYFMDVGADTWALDPAAVQARAVREGVGAILPVSPFGAPLNLAAWDAVQRSTGIPVVIDGAAAFDTLRVGGPMRLGSCPVAVSMHATKVFGVGEGGALLCRDPAVVDRVRRLTQFGFLGTREAVLPGTNAKLSEYAAAVGLAGLDSWPETRIRWLAATARYRQALPSRCRPSPGFGEGWVSSTLNVLFPTELAAETLRYRGIETLRWWGSGCHAQAAYAGYPSDDLPVTAELAKRVTGVPFSQDLPQRQVEFVCRAIAGCLEAELQPVAA